MREESSGHARCTFIIIINPQYVCPCVSDSTNENSQEIPGLFPACAVTRTMAKQAEKRSQLSDDLAKSHVTDLLLLFKIPGVTYFLTKN